MEFAKYTRLSWASYSRRKVVCQVKKLQWGRGGGGQVVSMLAFYSKDPKVKSSHIQQFFWKIIAGKNEITQ